MTKRTSILATIVAAQLVALVLIFNKIATVERDLADAINAQQVGVLRSEPAIATTPTPSGRTPDLPSDARIRQIIQEALRAELSHLSLTDRQVDSTVVPSAASVAEMTERREQLFEQLDYFTSVGRISDVEMQKLQLDISKLDSAGRTEALRRLARAMNSGRLDGRL